MSQIPKEFQWKTNDGRTLDIRWMDTMHLVHSFNMVVRNNNLNRQGAGQIEKNAGFANMRRELQARQRYYWSWDSSKGQDQLQIPNPPIRESHEEMCMLRAIIETKPANWENIVSLFHESPSRYIQHVVSCADPKWEPVMAKFVEYRLSTQKAA